MKPRIVSTVNNESIWSGKWETPFESSFLLWRRPFCSQCFIRVLNVDVSEAIQSTLSRSVTKISFQYWTYHFIKTLKRYRDLSFPAHNGRHEKESMKVLGWRVNNMQVSTPCTHLDLTCAHLDWHLKATVVVSALFVLTFFLFFSLFLSAASQRIERFLRDLVPLTP